MTFKEMLKGNVILIVPAIFIVSLIITLNLFLQQNYQAEMAEQFNKQQLLLADTISKNMKGHIEHIEEETRAFAKFLGDKKLTSPGLEGIVEDVFAEAGGDHGINLAIFDGKNRLVYSTHPDAPDGEDLLLAEKSMTLRGGDVIYLDRTIESKTVKLATPVIGDSGWQGAVVLDIHLDFINKKFLAPIKSGQKGYAWMMNRDGTLLYHPTQPTMIGKNLNRADKSCFDCHRSFEVEKWILGSGEAGARSYISPFGEDKLIAFSKANIFDTQWIICVSIPYSEITASIRKSMRLHSALVLVIFGATVIGAFSIIVINRKRIKAEEKARHEEELQRYANELEKMVDERTRELSTEKEKLNTIVNAVGGGLILIDKKGKILWANQTIIEMAGRDVVGRYCEEICGDCSFEQPLAAEGFETSIVESLFEKKGSFFQVTTAPVKSNGEIIGYIRFIQDVTEMKRVEEQMSHSEKLASIGRLTAGIAHEIGNPLTSVFSFLQLLREKETEEFKKESLDTILFHITRIADIVRQLSGLSKLPPAELRKISVNDIIESSLGLLQYDKRARDISLGKELEKDLPAVVTDGNQLSQVFVNMILNAVDAMPEGGCLTIRSGLSNGYITVEFEDTGVGIPKENLTKVFDPFFTTKDKGTGLGLSVSYGIIKRLGGDITVSSEINKGTRFTVKIPVEEKTHEG
jgi:PAS domain S-box-containing protein